MENLNKKTIRSNKAQILYLCQYMQEHPQFAAGEFRTPLGAAKNNHEWVKLKEALDELGPQRSVEQWKICWRDQKRKARAEAGAASQASNATGNNVPVSELSNTTALVLDAIGSHMAVGVGPAESPVSCVQSAPASASSHEPIVLISPVPPPAICRQIRNVHAQPQQRRRVRRSLPPDQFINAQLELNNLMKELIAEVRRGNNLKEEQLNLFRGAQPE